MKEELQLKLVDILTGIQTAVAKGADFAMDQIPDIAVQYLRFSLTWEVVEAVIAVVFMVALVKVCRHAWRKANDEYDDGFWAFTTVASGALSFFTFVSFMWSLKAITMMTLAPKVWLIKELATLVKG
ncbi:MAG: hypothetical protein B7X60_00140 [Polynucleobacter sp. 39-45-136]|jgi:uncharacterized membrane protein|nr:MAG: hypothetical protein B7X60_00140 [Polynucleobacter sp. 39-45-136]